MCQKQNQCSKFNLETSCALSDRGSVGRGANHPTEDQFSKIPSRTLSSRSWFQANKGRRFSCPMPCEFVPAGTVIGIAVLRVPAIGSILSGPPLSCQQRRKPLRVSLVVPWNPAIAEPPFVRW